MEKLMTWLGVPVRGVWLTRGSLILLVSIFLAAVAFIGTLLGFTSISIWLLIASMAASTLMMGFLVVEVIVKERQRNKPQ